MRVVWRREEDVMIEGMAEGRHNRIDSPGLPGTIDHPAETGD
jgi:hypothetical protein